MREIDRDLRRRPPYNGEAVGAFWFVDAFPAVPNVDISILHQDSQFTDWKIKSRT
jgi:hypothetical protein